MMDAEREKTCCFTGHRPSKLPWGYNESDSGCLRLKAAVADVLSALYGDGVRRFLCGMAEGADMYFAEAVIALREQRPDVTLEAVIPFEGQERRWPERSRRRYGRLVLLCDACTVLHGEYAREHYLERDRYMADRSAVLVAVYGGKRGGTRYTMEYAAARGLTVVQIPLYPETGARGDIYIP